MRNKPEHPNPENCCRVCGLDQGEPIWGKDGQCPTYAICSCCGVEFGYGDTSRDNCRTVREYWLNEEGAKWRYPENEPKIWSLDEQLKNIPVEFW